MDRSSKKANQKFYWAGHYAMMTLNVDQRFIADRGAPGSLGPSVDTSFMMTKQSSGSWGLSSGIFFKLGQTGKTSILAMEIGFGMNLYKWDLGTIKYSSYDAIKDETFSLHINLPISVQLKTGGEAMLDPKHKFLFSMGAGFDPCVVGTKVVIDEVNLKIRSFLMTEIGVHAGIAFKLRAYYYPSDLALINKTVEEVPNSLSPGKFSMQAYGSNNFVLALLFMPYSNHWGDGTFTKRYRYR
jgi:hypothetical protein